jgi:hypothetical protein
MTITTRSVFATLAAIMLVSSAVAPAAAQSQPAWADSMYGDFSEMVPKYNENAGSLELGLANGLLEDQRVTIRVDSGSGTAYYWFDTDANKRITDHGQGEHPDGATLVIRTSRNTLSEIATADNPVASFRDAVRDNRVTFSGKTPTTFVVGIGVSIGQRLGLLG